LSYHKKITYLLTYCKKVKFFPASWAHEAALISVSTVALSRTPAEATRPRIRG